MCADKADQKPNLILSVLQNKCPRCRRGKMYLHGNPYRLKKLMQMHERCPVCGQPLDMEPGFYYGTNMISYALAVLFSAASFIAWFALIGFSFHDKRFFWWMGVNALLLVLLQPLLMRLSRSIWIAIFVHYSSNWSKGDIMKPERTNRQHQNNW